jgi:hypothetical protein
VEISINGSIQSSFPTLTGTQQGGPASPILFNYYLDPTSGLLPMHGKIKDLNHPRVLILCFADDILYAGSEKFLPTVINAFVEFSERSHLRFAPHKCIYQGSLSPPQIYGTPILKRSSANYLGTIISRHGIPESWQNTLLARSHLIIPKITSILDLKTIPISRRATIYKTFVRSSAEYLFQLGSILGNHLFGHLKLFRQGLSDILLLPHRCVSPLLMIYLKMEHPYNRLTRLQWLWLKKMEGSPLPIHRALMNPNHPVFRELHNPGVLKFDHLVRSLPPPPTNAPAPSNTSRAWSASIQLAWTTLQTQCPESYTLLKMIPMSTIRRALDTSSDDLVLNFFSTHKKLERLAWLQAFIDCENPHTPPNYEQPTSPT